MPAVTPAEVYSRPSRTKILSGSTVICGWVSARRVQADQWVVARWPSSSPAAASTNAPVQTEATRSLWPAAVTSHRRRTGSAAAASWPRPPATSSVSIAAREDGNGWVPMTSPLEVVIDGAW